jgi:hypothetical protein
MKVRYLIHVWFQNEYRKNKLGAVGRAVEVDESKFNNQTKEGMKCNV